MKVFVVASLLIAICSAVSALGQSPRRISFARGTHSATVEGGLSGEKERLTYVMRVRAGETIWTDQTGGEPVSIAFIAPSGKFYRDDLDRPCQSSRTVTPTEAGDYTLFIVPCEKPDGEGRFEILVTARLDKTPLKK